MNLHRTLVLMPEPLAMQAYRRVIGIPFNGFPLLALIALIEYSCRPVRTAEPANLEVLPKGERTAKGISFGHRLAQLYP